MSKQFNQLKPTYTLLDTVTFGKYAGSPWEDITQFDPEYIFWIVSNMDIPISREVLVASIKSITTKNKKIEKDRYSRPRLGSVEDFDFAFDDIPF